jgi:hypothetical protein
MKHLFEMVRETPDGPYRYWEFYKGDPHDSYIDQFVRDIEEEDICYFLDRLMEDGVDFVIHTQEGFDEYHLAVSVPSEQAS